MRHSKPFVLAIAAVLRLSVGVGGAGCAADGDDEDAAFAELQDPEELPLDTSAEGKADLASTLKGKLCKWGGFDVTIKSAGMAAAKSCAVGAAMALVVTGGTASLPACLTAAGRSVATSLAKAGANEAQKLICGDLKLKARTIIPCEEAVRAGQLCY